jgi:hypothetical protein
MAGSLHCKAWWVVTDESYLPTPCHTIECCFVRSTRSVYASNTGGKMISFPVREGQERERKSDTYPVTMQYGFCMRSHYVSHI